MRPIALTLIVFAGLIPACRDRKPPPVDAPVPTSDTPLQSCETSTTFLMDCTSNEFCMGCTCKPFGHVMYCSKACTVSTDCQAPSTGCLNGFCTR